MMIKHDRQTLLRNSLRDQIVSVLLPIAGLAIGLTFVLLGTYSNAHAATTTPGTIGYQARLLNSSNVPLTGSYSVRFSLWSDADFTPGVDVDGAGAIVIAAPGYAGWQETQTVTTDSFGLFDVAIGSITPFPNFTNGTHDFLQIEVKPTASPATAFEVLDPVGTIADGTDRSVLNQSAYAENADTVDNAEVGTGLGDLALLSVGGIWDISQIPAGTDAENFIFNNNDGGDEDVTLQFGNDATNATITFDDGTGNVTFATAGGAFDFSDDSISTTGAINFSGGSQFRIREDADPATNSACANVAELIYDTTDKKLQHCTATGAAGAATWTNVDTTAGSSDFEAVYDNDAGNNLVTNDAIFTITTGTNDFVVDSNDWNVTADGALNAVSISDGTATLTAGSLSGLTGADGTTENTIEGLIFDADVESITGVWTVVDNVTFNFGSDGDVMFMYDETTNDRLEITGTGATVYIEDNLLVGAGAETILNGAFTLGGDDVFIGGDLGVEGPIYTDNTETKYLTLELGAGVKTKVNIGTIAGGNSPVARFNNGEESNLRFSFPMPDDWESGTDILVDLFWSPAIAGVAENMEWDFDYDAIAVGEQVLVGGFTNLTDQEAVPTTINEVAKTTFTIANGQLAANDMVNINITRTDTGSNANDDYLNPINLHMIRIKYTGKKLL